MTCPKCGGEMRRGYLNAKSWIGWSENQYKMVFPWLTAGVRLNGFAVEKYPPAWNCEQCQILVIPYGEDSRDTDDGAQESLRRNI